MPSFRTILLAAAAGVTVIAPGASPGAPKREAGLTLQRVARYPRPGTRIPTAFRFSHDGRFLYFLQGENRSTVRSLVREEVASGRREIVARPPGGSAGTTGALPPEEILRRERQRIQDQGITGYALAEEADVAVFAYAGDLYRARAGGDPERLTETPETEEDPQLSPDGTRLAFVREGDLFVLDLAGRSETRLTEGARDGLTHGLAEYIAQEEMDRSSGFWWSRDGAFLAYAEVDETDIPVYPIVHQGGASWDVERHRYPFAGGPNARVRLGVIPAGGGATRWLNLAPEGGEFYLARVLWDRDGSLLVQVQSRDQRRLRLLRFEGRSRRGTLLLEERSETFINLHEDLRTLADGRFLWSSESSGYRHLEVRARDGTLVRRLTAGDWAVDGVAGLDEERGLVYFTAGKDSPLERRLYRVALDGAPVAVIAGEPGIHAATFPRHGRLFVDVHDSAARPPRVTLRDASGSTLRTIDSNDDPEPRVLGLEPPEFVTLAAADGTTLYGAVYKPRPMRPGRRYPAIVSVYGGPTAQMVKNAWEITSDLRAQYLSRHGYVVFRLDNRGSEGRGRRFQEALFHRLGSIEVEDQIAGARWLGARPYVDRRRLGIYGWSYGGYMAARCLLLAPDLFRAAVAGAPVTDWDGYDTYYTEHYMGTPRDNAEGYRESSLLPLAGRLEGRLLLIHGMSDENVHFRHTARLINALNTAGKTYDLLVFPDERHLPRGEDDRRFLEERLVAHFDRALGRP
jgi:dipeptidyl-peptidase-4